MKSRNLAFWAEKRNSQFWTEFGWKMGKWPTDRQKKIIKCFHIHWLYHNVFTVGLKELMPTIIRMRIEKFSSTNQANASSCYDHIVTSLIDDWGMLKGRRVRKVGGILRWDVILAQPVAYCGLSAPVADCILPPPKVVSCIMPPYHPHFCCPLLVQSLIIITVRLAPFQCVAPLAANNLQSGRSSASSVASSTLRLWYDRSFFILGNRRCENVLGKCSKNSPGICLLVHSCQVAKQLQ